MFASARSKVFDDQYNITTIEKYVEKEQVTFRISGGHLG